MKIIAVEKAVGKKISHELTGIVPGSETKKIFPKGHVITEDDVEQLKDMGKYEIIILDENSSLIHENEGAHTLALSGAGVHCKLMEAKEGKVTVHAERDGLFKVDVERLKYLNLIDGIMVSTKKNYTPVKAGEKIAVFGITPLEIDENILDEALVLLREALVSVLSFHQLKIGLITTGTEIYSGRIKDAFFPYVENHLKKYGYQLNEQIILPDDQHQVEEALEGMVQEKYQIILLSGGMSVDANDITKEVIRSRKDIEVVSYGTPVLPGAMFLVAYNKGIPVIGLPAGLLRGGPSIFDFVLPLLLAKEPITKEYIASLSHGGLL